MDLIFNFEHWDLKLYMPKFGIKPNKSNFEAGGSLLPYEMIKTVSKIRGSGKARPLVS